MPTSGGGSGAPVSGGVNASPLTLIPHAQGHALLGGPESFYSGTAGAGSDATRLVAEELIDSSGAKSWTGAKVYVHTGTGAGQARYVQTVDLSAGNLVVNRSFSPAPDATSEFWLLKHFSRAQWVAFANQALREMRHRVTYVQTSGVAGTQRITVPTTITSEQDVVDIRYGVSSTPSAGTTLPWFGFTTIDGQLYLHTSQHYDNCELLYDVLVPYAGPGDSPLVVDADTTAAPLDWLVSEMVALAMTTRWANATTEADKRRLQQDLGAAGRLVAGMRAKYQSQPGRRMIPADAV